MPTSADSGSPGRGKQTTFRVAAILLPLFGFALLEIGCRIVAPASTAADPFINISSFSVFSREQSEGVEYFRLTHKYAYAERNVRVPVLKPRGTLRIVALGGSACAGWPHPPEETFDRYLESALKRALPDREVEVVNVAAHGFASYRVRHVFDEVLALDPDVVIVYSGNNEFLEDREYASRGLPLVDSLARNLRIVQWLRSLVQRPKTELSGDELKDVASFFYKKVKRQALELRQDPEKFEAVKEHYAASIEHVTSVAEERGIDVLLFTVPVNLRDWLPTVSHNGLTGDDLEIWRRHDLAGQRAVLLGEPAEGIEELRAAIEMEPLHAESWFWMGRLLEAAGDRDQARVSYERARDLDYNPFRAHGDFGRIAAQIAERYDTTHLVDLVEEFRMQSESGAPGFDLFVDYVHPNRDGNVLIAAAAYRALFDSGVLNGVARDTAFAPPGPSGYDERSDGQLQVRLFGLYAMNHQYDAAIRTAEHLAELATGQPFTGGEMPDVLPDPVRDGYRVFREYQAARREEILGQPPDEERRARLQGRLDAFLEKWFAYGTF